MSYVIQQKRKRPMEIDIDGILEATAALAGLCAKRLNGKQRKLLPDDRGPID